MQDEQERAEFEAWAGDQGFPLGVWPTATSQYRDARTEGAWEGWQAARRSPPAQAGAGVVEALRTLVACKDTEDRLHALHEMGHGTDWDQHRRQFAAAWPAARDALSAAPHPAGEVPAGYALVPVEITEQMHVAAVRTIIRCTGNADFPPRVWRAMLAAAPLPPKGEAATQPARCGYCDGTGDVHGLDGEWRGTCTECPAAEHFQAEHDREVGRKWRTDGRLEEWFPLTAEELSALRVEVSKLRATQPAGEEAWRPIETVPNDTEEILCLNRSGRVRIEMGRFVHHFINAAKVDEEECYYTHWQPLPPPPTAARAAQAQGDTP